ncbi:Aldo/keto reductase [Ceraceosorus guamensis]|uniref:Aldo/keto reductase n=1 Tax=Ceraceosorus guamensis TaxID=1522189 RepID=A0A316WCI1_9BASI|nr:Aldo/keto reductase [Ceraceosorus guamensis]PWN45245.1 Aldo/keto reductase [Ceraceosorus guamensis]
MSSSSGNSAPFVARWAPTPGVKLDLSSTVPLADGNTMPLFGIGAWAMRGSECHTALSLALDQVGYRHIDTARYYRNEKEVGAAVRGSKVPRKDIFVTTKLFTNDMGGGARSRAALDDSLRQSGLDYFDLVLLHAPDGGKEFRLNTWQTLSEMAKEGKAKSLGISNFGEHHVRELMQSEPQVVPVVNQIECHPFFAQAGLRKACEDAGIIVQAYCPLARSRYYGDKTLSTIASKVNKSEAQVMLRWLIQSGVVPLPKSSNQGRQEENAKSLDFELDSGDMQKLNALDRGPSGAVESQTMSQDAP